MGDFGLGRSKRERKCEISLEHQIIRNKNTTVKFNLFGIRGSTRLLIYRGEKRYIGRKIIVDTTPLVPKNRKAYFRHWMRLWFPASS